MTRFAVIVMLMLTLPMTVFARMDSLTEEAMGEVTGQTGITIDLTWQLNDSYLAWTDNDGFGTTVSQNEGSLTLYGLTIDDNGSPITISGITLDVGTNGSGDSYLMMGLPTIEGQLGIQEIYIGSQIASGGSLGRVFIGDLNMENSTIRVTPH
ncbi:conserved hypothetical protein [Desulfatibacillum aliphaticivorans]|uniref:DUF6160 domain-containing protein n=1 Tax=Desulfatibacillum aliphaticivorans TaxID=218208 RepID=B8FF49_DESAL|nr:DUF6160 family protein [Desulfatibacillum aliphaticivorans]ACL03866.1 conserved hypothetical protein [Desulfatibacillum aliphaticivorans]